MKIVVREKADDDLEARSAVWWKAGCAKQPALRPQPVDTSSCAISGFPSQWFRKAASQARPTGSYTARSAKCATRGLAFGSDMRSCPRVVQRHIMAWVTSG